MAYAPNGDLTPPSNPDVQLWRYLDVAKLLSMLETGSLHFARLNTFQDPWEGAVGPPNTDFFKEAFGPNSVDASHLPALLWKMRTRHLSVSCWHMSEHESAAMWSAYADRGLAVRTTWRRLTASITDERHVTGGEVRYVDFARDVIPERNLFLPVMHKRMSFSHEREVRLLLPDFGPHPGPVASAQDEVTDADNDWQDYETSPTSAVGVDLVQLLAGVNVSPVAPAWLTDLIGQVLARYGLPDVPVVRSDLYDAPEIV
ncbi:DUF2971 domain-containing protein [uncultured Modestobacter sp.]|uniref:DUF2971 domain-containing protein n=1 Tax=uncultured Modestobacter sp. TaxID=380048 RepID=UPI0026397A7B|nr:DUF2971 domain-containing protein [uncultured Modestobacter sp.]